MGLLYLALGWFAIGLLTMAFEHGAKRRFPEWHRFLAEVGFILGGICIAVLLVFLLFASLALWG